MAPTTNPWLKHVKAYRKAHPKMEYKAVLQKASKTYKKNAPPKKYKNGTPYNYGRAWTMDRYRFNKDEAWEIPPSKRKLALR